MQFPTLFVNIGLFKIFNYCLNFIPLSEHWMYHVDNNYGYYQASLIDRSEKDNSFKLLSTPISVYSRMYITKIILGCCTVLYSTAIVSKTFVFRVIIICILQIVDSWCNRELLMLSCLWNSCCALRNICKIQIKRNND